MAIERAAVIGAGTMGAEIAQVIAERGIPVYLKDVSQEFLDRGLNHIRGTLKRRVERGRITEDQAQAVLANVTPTLVYGALADVDFVVEAVPENLKLKKQIFSDLDSALKSDAILATNTSSLSITDVAQATKRPGQVVGFHFFNPATVMKLIEVVASPETSPATMDAAVGFAEGLGKLPVRVKECAGFLVNRILVAGLVEGLRYQDETQGDPRQIDAAITERTGIPMGPFALGDLVGLDVALAISQILVNAYGDRFTAPASLQRMVSDGRLGQKTGAGYYDRSGQPAEGLGSEPIDKDAVADRFVAASMLEAFRCLDEGIASARDIDMAMLAGAGWKVGPLTMAQQMGVINVVMMLDRLAAQYGDRFTPPASVRQAAEKGA